MKRPACWLVATTPAMLCGCGALVQSDTPEACEEVLGAVVYDHACQHGRLGPFTEVVASADANSTLPGLNRRQHVADVVFKSSVDGRDQTYSMAYTPSRDGEHAIFTGWNGVRLSVRMFEGETELERTHSESVPAPQECGDMHKVVVFELVKGVEYRVEMGPTGEARTRLFFEHPPTYGADSWELSCGLL